jgi:hypothetical protein
VYDRTRPAALRPGCLNQRMPRPRRALGLTVAALAARSFTMEGWAWSRAACRAAQQEAMAFREWGAAPHEWSDERRAPRPTCGDWDRVCQQEAQRQEARPPAPAGAPAPASARREAGGVAEALGCWSLGQVWDPETAARESFASEWGWPEDPITEHALEEAAGEAWQALVSGQDPPPGWAASIDAAVAGRLPAAPGERGQGRGGAERATHGGGRVVVCVATTAARLDRFEGGWRSVRPRPARLCEPPCGTLCAK